MLNSEIQKIKLSNAFQLFIIYFEAQKSRYYDLQHTLNSFVI